MLIVFIISKKTNLPHIFALFGSVVSGQSNSLRAQPG